jgi:hypothetical protein
VGDTGLEHLAKTPAKPKDSGRGGAESGAVSPGFGPKPSPAASSQDPDLATVAAAWPHLPEAIKADIVAVVKAADEAGR